MVYFLYMSMTHLSKTTEQPETCATRPLGRAMRLLGDVWTLIIIYTLLSGPRRFGELLEAMGNVSPKTLSQRLKMLEEMLFVERRYFAEIPPRVRVSPDRERAGPRRHHGGDQAVWGTLPPRCRTPAAGLRVRLFLICNLITLFLRQPL